MLTKKNVWFMTLFSIILVMTIYYVSGPSIDSTSVSENVKDDIKDVSVSINSTIGALRIDREEILTKEVNAIKEILQDTEKTTSEKSDAYEALKSLNVNKGREEALESDISKNFNYENFVKIDGSNVKVVVDSKTHSYELANKIIALVQKSFTDNMYVTVSFEE